MYHELTETDIKKMEEEIEHRKVVVRKQLLEAVKEARAQGDLSENFEYYAAKREKNKNESRIRYLEREIRTAKMIEDTSKEDEIGLFNTVTLYYEDDDEEEEDEELEDELSELESSSLGSDGIIIAGASSTILGRRSSGI